MHLKETVPHLEHAVHVGLETGDLEWAGYNSVLSYSSCVEITGNIDNYSYSSTTATVCSLAVRG